MVVTFNLHVLKFLEELFLFCILCLGLLSKMLDLLQVKCLLLVKFALRSDLDTIGFFFLLQGTVHLFSHFMQISVKLFTGLVDLLLSFEFHYFFLLESNRKTFTR